MKARVNVVKPSKMAELLRDLEAGKVKRLPRQPEMTDEVWAAFEKKREEEKLAKTKARIEEEKARRAKNDGHAPPENVAGPSAMSERQEKALVSQRHYEVTHHPKSSKPKDSTRFFLRVAKDMGSVRLAALVFYVAICTSRKSDSCWRTKTAELGAQIGVKAWQTEHLLKQASDAEALEALGSPKLLNYQKTRRGVMVSVADKTLYDLMQLEHTDSEPIGYYRLSLAKKLRSIDAAIAHGYLYPPQHMDDDFDTSLADEYVPLGGHYITAGKLMRLCPWIKRSTAYRALNKLVAAKMATRRLADRPSSDLESVYEYVAIQQEPSSAKTTPSVPRPHD